MHGKLALTVGLALSAASLFSASAATSDGLPPLQVDPSWSTADRASYVSAPDVKDVVLATLDSTPFSGDVKEFEFPYDTPGFLLFLR